MSMTISGSYQDSFGRIDALLEQARNLAEKKRGVSQQASAPQPAAAQHQTISIQPQTGPAIQPAASEMDQAYGEVLRMMGSTATEVHGGLDPARVARLLDL